MARINLFIFDWKQLFREKVLPGYFSLKNTKQTKLYEMKRVFRKNLKKDVYWRPQEPERKVYDVRIKVNIFRKK